MTNEENIRRGTGYGARKRRAVLGGVCRNGHTYTEENSRVTKRGYLLCLSCQRDGMKRYKERQRVARSER